MGTAGEGAGRGAAAAGKGCPGNRAGLHSGSEPNSKMQNDRLHGGSCKHKGTKGTRAGLEKGRHRVRWGPTLSFTTFHLPEKKKKENSSLNPLAWVNRKKSPFNMRPFVATEGSWPPALLTSLMKQYTRRRGEKSLTLQLYGGPKLSLLPLFYLH